MRLRKWIWWTVAIVVGLPVFIVSVENGGAYVVGHPPITHFLLFQYKPTSRFILHELPFMGGTFTLEKWQEAGNCTGGECSHKEHRCPRGSMVNDLMDNHLIAGETTRVQVEALLGPRTSEYKHGDQMCLQQMIGMCSGLGIDHDFLYVCFDDAGLVTESWHWQH